MGWQTQAIVSNLRPEVLEEVIDAELVGRVRDAGAFGPNVEWAAINRWRTRLEAHQKIYYHLEDIL